MRPELIAQLHGAYLDTKQQPENAHLQAHYEQLLGQGIEQYHCTREDLLKVLEYDYRKWLQDEGLKPHRR